MSSTCKEKVEKKEEERCILYVLIDEYILSRERDKNREAGTKKKLKQKKQITKKKERQNGA